LIIRKIKPEENVEANMIGTVAFANSFDYTEKLKDPFKYADGYEIIWGAFTDDGVMTSCVEVFPYAVMFDGNIAKMAGVGGVASLPEYRAGGAIRHILAEAMRVMFADGQVFSYLYPFSYKYYRKFGYELCFNRYVVKLSPSSLRGLKPAGGLIFFKKDDDIAPYTDIYRRFISGFNLAIVRNDEDFSIFINKDPYISKQYTYLWHNDSGVLKSYITFTGARLTEWSSQMKINEFAWVDTEGLYGMLSLLGRFDVQYKEIYWEAPDIINPYSLLEEPYDMEISMQRGGMNRIINLEKALSLMKAPDGDGGVIISVTDSFLEWNNGTFEILWGGGKLNAAKTTSKPDIEVGVEVLVQLVCGYITPDIAETSGRLTIRKNRNNLNRLFYKKNLYITDRF